jgi:hypothetical protein
MVLNWAFGARHRSFKSVVRNSVVEEAWYKGRGKVKGKAVVKVNGNGKGVVRNGVVQEAW